MSRVSNIQQVWISPRAFPEDLELFSLLNGHPPTNRSSIRRQQRFASKHEKLEVGRKSCYSAWSQPTAERDPAKVPLARGRKGV